MDKIIIALDAMGGDGAPMAVIEGAELALKRNKKLFFKIFGQDNKVMPVILKQKLLINNYEFTHTDAFIQNEDKPAEALRKGRQSSMRLAINCVKEGKADAIVSAGNTGALMAMSKFVFNTIIGIDRPAIVTCIPTKNRDKPCVILDLGANAESSKEQLLQFAIMGDAFAKSYLSIERPRIALLNIGSEVLKGNELIQSAAELISQNTNLNYVGFIEGDGFFESNVDVIVTDGFTGNVALKVLEGTAKFIKFKLTSIFKGKIISYIGLVFLALFSAFHIKRVGKEIDPRNYNGAMFVGLDGISVKSHGSADKVSFANAIDVAQKLVIGKVNDKIKAELNN